VIVLEKAVSYGNQGPLYSDIKSALYRMDDRPILHNYILGLGGREIKTQQLLEILAESCKRPGEIEDTPRWIGLKLQEESHG
jgi:pyruvate ferredoxin oxidoreductase alpha subunit